MSEDKRRAERFNVNEEFASLTDEETMTFVSDLSEHGVFVHSRHRIDVGQLIDLRFTLVLDDPVVIEARGRVVRHSEAGMGVEFTDLTPEMVLRIHDAISRQRSMQREAEKLAAEQMAARAAGEQKSFDDAKTGVYRVPEVDPDDIEEDDEDDPDEGR